MSEKKLPDKTSPDLFEETSEPQDGLEQTFEEQLSRLEDIVKRMESGGLTLSESVKLYEEGSRHLERLTAMLNTVREKVMVLASTDEGKQELEDYTGENSV